MVKKTPSNLSFSILVFFLINVNMTFLFVPCGIYIELMDTLSSKSYISFDFGQGRTRSGSDSETGGSDSETAGYDSETGGSDSGTGGSDTETAGSDSETAGSDSETAGSDSETAGSDSETAGSRT